MLSSLEVDGHVAGPTWRCALPTRKRMSGPRVYKVCQDLCALLTFPVTPGALLTTETGMI